MNPLTNRDIASYLMQFIPRWMLRTTRVVCRAWYVPLDRIIRTIYSHDIAEIPRLVGESKAKTLCFQTLFDRYRKDTYPFNRASIKYIRTYTDTSEKPPNATPVRYDWGDHDLRGDRIYWATYYEYPKHKIWNDKDASHIRRFYAHYGPRLVYNCWIFKYIKHKLERLIVYTNDPPPDDVPRAVELKISSAYLDVAMQWVEAVKPELLIIKCLPAMPIRSDYIGWVPYTSRLSKQRRPIAFVPRWLRRDADIHAADVSIRSMLTPTQSSLVLTNILDFLPHWMLTTYRAINRECWQRVPVLMIRPVNNLRHGPPPIDPSLFHYTRPRNLDEVIAWSRRRARWHRGVSIDVSYLNEVEWRSETIAELSIIQHGCSIPIAWPGDKKIPKVISLHVAVVLHCGKTLAQIVSAFRPEFLSIRWFRFPNVYESAEWPAEVARWIPYKTIARRVV